MRLSEKQQIFTACIGKLILFASSKEYGLTQGDGYRDPRVFGEMGEKRSYASKNSVHKIRLAHDFNLFVKGEFWCKNVAGKNFNEYWDYPLSWESISKYPKDLKKVVLSELDALDTDKKAKAKYNIYKRSNNIAM